MCSSQGSGGGDVQDGQDLNHRGTEIAEIIKKERKYIRTSVKVVIYFMNNYIQPKLANQ